MSSLAGRGSDATAQIPALLPSASRTGPAPLCSIAARLEPQRSQARSVLNRQTASRPGSQTRAQSLRLPPPAVPRSPGGALRASRGTVRGARRQTRRLSSPPLHSTTRPERHRLGRPLRYRSGKHRDCRRKHSCAPTKTEPSRVCGFCPPLRLGIRDQPSATMLLRARLGRWLCFPDRDITDTVRRSQAHLLYSGRLRLSAARPLSAWNKATHNIALCPGGRFAASLTPSSPRVMHGYHTGALRSGQFA